MIISIWSLNSDDPEFPQDREYRVGYSGEILDRQKISKKTVLAKIEPNTEWTKLKNSHVAEEWILNELCPNGWYPRK